MKDVSHFQIKGSFNQDNNRNENNQIDLNFRNINEDEIIEILRHPFCQGIQQMVNVQNLNEIQVHRKTLLDEIQQIMKDHGFSKNRSETWISESLRKVLNFQNNGIPIEKRSQQRILELTLNRRQYNQFRFNDVIPQFRSKGSSKSVYNYEGIPGGACQSKASTISPTVERNIGINKNHIDKFNECIESINVLDPDDPFVKNKFLRYISQNKLKSCMIAISVIYEIKNLTIILMDENGCCIERLLIHTTEMIINQIGSNITLALASLLPGIGSFAIGVLGSLIFGFIGKKIGELIFSLFPKIASGEGPPISDYFSFVYGSNNYFGEPLNEYNFQTILGIPKSDYPVNINEVAFKSPSNDYEDQFVQMAFQCPK
ncbi:unnamed protein product [Rotaria sp. Silwood2]|nr:unnamed protein product [Rotaria sp. Silwood2]CAF4515200.1 unnamed protein product [Rotaria sp. Silwood2]